ICGRRSCFRLTVGAGKCAHSVPIAGRANHAGPLAADLARLLIDRQMPQFHAVVRCYAAEVAREIFNGHATFAIDLTEASCRLLDALAEFKRCRQLRQQTIAFQRTVGACDGYVLVERDRLSVKSQSVLPSNLYGCG